MTRADAQTGAVTGVGRKCHVPASAAQRYTMESVFTYGNLYDAYRRSRRNVGWKASVQVYVCQAPLNVHLVRKCLLDGTYRPKRQREFDIRDRGKVRHITSVHIGDRVVQRCLCDNFLVPALSRSFTYDNSASQVGKGYHFAHKRLTEHLRWHYRRHGTDGWALLADFHGYFGSIPHGLVKSMVRDMTDDKRLVALCDMLIDANESDRGLGLGSQASQVLALAAASRIDHHAKDDVGIRCYGRYMDDMYAIHESKDVLVALLADIRGIAASLGLEINERKTRVVRLSRGFTFCKARYLLTDTGKVVRRIHPKSVTRMRRRLKAFRRKVDMGEMDEGDAWRSYQGWRAYARTFDSRRTVRNMDELFDSLFPDMRVGR